MSGEKSLIPGNNQFLMYSTEDGDTKIEVLYEGESVWLTQAQMAELFQTERSVITKHIQNVFQSGELEEESNVQKMHNGISSKPVNIYNLDVIISVGYRVNSLRGTKFRIWATRNLSEFIVKGFIMDDERLMRGGSNYFDELYARVRRIRTSEVNFYKKVRSLFATSIDYDNSSAQARTFYATVQNKFHYAIHQHTAAELIMSRVAWNSPNMGLTHWTGEVVSLKDAFIAKNYLQETEIKRLELLVDQFLSFAELQAVEKKTMYMRDWIRKLDEYIGILNEKPVLVGSGTKSHKDMEKKVRSEYEAYCERMMIEKDLDNLDDLYDMWLVEAYETMPELPADEDEDDYDSIQKAKQAIFKKAVQSSRESEHLGEDSNNKSKKSGL